MWRIAGAGLLGATGFMLGASWQPVWVALAGGGGVALAGLWQWLHARRTSSGTVRTSEAGKLWDAYDRVMVRVESDNTTLREDNAKLRERVAVLERETDRLEREVERLRGIVNGHD